jgi:hypothetical protein
MNLDGLFEDLEAQFDAELNIVTPRQRFESSNLVTIWNVAGGTATQLAAPILGVDFVAGMVLGANCFRLNMLPIVARMELSTLQNADIPKCRFVSVTAIEFLERLPLPFAVKWRAQASASLNLGNVLDILGHCLLVESIGSENLRALPIDSLALLELCDVENFGELS